MLLLIQETAVTVFVTCLATTLATSNLTSLPLRITLDSVKLQIDDLLDKIMLTLIVLSLIFSVVKSFGHDMIAKVKQLKWNAKDHYEVNSNGE